MAFTTDCQQCFTIGTDDQSETISLGGNASQLELESIASLIDEVSEYAQVASTARDGVMEELAADDPPPISEDYEKCSDDCKTDHPGWHESCDDNPQFPSQEDEVQDCAEKFACCVNKANYVKCVGECFCHLGNTPHDGVQDCLAQRQFFHVLMVGGCLDQLGQCLQFIPASWP